MFSTRNLKKEYKGILKVKLIQFRDILTVHTLFSHQQNSTNV